MQFDLKARNCSWFVLILNHGGNEPRCLELSLFQTMPLKPRTFSGVQHHTFVQSMRLTSRILKEISSTGQTKIETSGLALSLLLPLHFASLWGGGGDANVLVSEAAVSNLLGVGKIWLSFIERNDSRVARNRVSAGGRMHHILPSQPPLLPSASLRSCDKI